jgi:hypothetical protein
MRTLIAALLAIGLAAPTAAISAPPCKDAKGKFIACSKHAAPAKRCKANGKFAKCGTPGAKPI